MANEIQIFNNPQFGEIRVNTNEQGEPMFCLADVCRILELTAKVVNQRLDDEVVSKYPILDVLGREQLALFVNEDGLYDVILDSRKPEAKKFRKWVTSEVLPSIRKHGGYLTPQKVEEALLNPDVLIRLATDLKDERQKRLTAESKIAEDAPKVLFANAVVGSTSTCLIGELAKVISQNGYPIGQNRLFKWLRSNGYLGTKGERYNIPNQQYIEMGLFEIKKGVRSAHDGVMITTSTTKVTGCGQEYFINKFLGTSAVS